MNLAKEIPVGGSLRFASYLEANSGAATANRDAA